MKERRLSRGLAGTGGVALADILANSVAVLLILIFLSISVKQEQAEQQIEQTVDISVLMARKLADSVVLNALPSSRPAYLHDYNSCAIPHDCFPDLFPVIEIYDKFARILNTNQIIDRHSMLQSTNALDEYLASIDSNQINNIRVDIYGIGMFYLVVSTLREFKAPLRHWHFLGEKAKSSSKGDGTSTKDALFTQLLEQGTEGLADTTDNGQGASQQLPRGVNLADPNQMAGLEEENLLLPPEELGAAEGQSAQSQGLQGQQEPSENLLNQLLEQFDRSRNQQDDQQELARAGNRRFQLRLPNFSPSQDTEPVQLDLDPEHIEPLMITFLFMAMEDARANNFFDPGRLGQLFAQLINNPESYRNYRHYSLIRDIVVILRQLSANPEKKISIDFQQQETGDPVQLLLAPNSAVHKVLLSGERLLAGQEELISGGTSQVDILMRLYPFVYRGDRATISSDMMTLMHPDDFRYKGERWFPVALVSHDLQQMTLGFVYGVFRGGNLVVPVEVNQVRAQSVMLQSDFGTPPRRLAWQIASAFILSGLIFLFIIITIVGGSYKTE